MAIGLEDDQDEVDGLSPGKTQGYEGYKYVDVEAREVSGLEDGAGPLVAAPAPASRSLSLLCRMCGTRCWPPVRPRSLEGDGEVGHCLGWEMSRLRP